MAYKEPEGMSPEEFEAEASKALEKDRTSRMRAALAMKIAGANYSEIAETLGYADVARARQAVELAMGSAVDDDSREKARALANLKYDRILRAIWPKATQEKIKNPITEQEEINHEQLSAARTAIVLIKEQARLNGAERPQEVVVYTPLQHELQEELKRLMSQVQGDMPEEIDVITSTTIERDRDDEAS